ncbi:Hypothetical predicted protein [Mytilus galloprovincialis]|uniref:Uncharacterized protein n=1 Tax=Mytilus galloprovincialis TaxID=29158 RepID=A0A8B6DJ18_MYTGA|nr:Hypothetical predicted protein [Mytilus galloprovincialis]
MRCKSTFQPNNSTDKVERDVQTPTTNMDDKFSFFLFQLVQSYGFLQSNVLSIKHESFGCSCSDEFYDFLLHSSYVRLPIECFESNSTKMKWHYMYTEIPKKFPVRQTRTYDEEEPNTCTTTDDTVSSAAWNTCHTFQ